MLQLNNFSISKTNYQRTQKWYQKSKKAFLRLVTNSDTGKTKNKFLLRSLRLLPNVLKKQKSKSKQMVRQKVDKYKLGISKNK